MEFRCRLASPNGEIVEGVYVADSEARLRHELEEKGLFVLSLQPKGAIGGPVARVCRRGSAIASREFLVFNQELATLLKAGMPLVQSLDLLKRRVDVAGVPEPCSTTSTRRCARARRCRTRSPRTATVSARLHGVAAGRRAQRQSRCGAATLRRVHEGHRDGEAQDDLGARLPGDPDRRSRWSWCRSSS